VELLKKLEKNGLYRITGTFKIADVPVHVEILTGIRFGRPQFAVGFAFDQESYGALAKKLSGIGVDFLDVIGLNLEVINNRVLVLSLLLFFGLLRPGSGVVPSGTSVERRLNRHFGRDELESQSTAELAAKGTLVPKCIRYGIQTGPIPDIKMIAFFYYVNTY